MLYSVKPLKPNLNLGAVDQRVVHRDLSKFLIESCLFDRENNGETHKVFNPCFWLGSNSIFTGKSKN